MVAAAGAAVAVLFGMNMPAQAHDELVPPASVPTTLVPAVEVPGVSVPPVTLPPVSVPGVSVPSVSVPSVTLPPVSLPPVTLPPLGVPSVGGHDGAELPASTPDEGGPLRASAADRLPAARELDLSITASDDGRVAPSMAPLSRTAVASVDGHAGGVVAAEALPERLRRAAAATAEQLSFPLLLALAMAVFLVVQHRVDEGDTRVANQNLGGDDELLGFS